MSSFTLLQLDRRMSTLNATLDDTLREGAENRFTSLMRLTIFLPWFVISDLYKDHIWNHLILLWYSVMSQVLLLFDGVDDNVHRYYERTILSQHSFGGIYVDQVMYYVCF